MEADTPLLKKTMQLIRKSGSPEKAAVLSRFFKTGPGEYAEGDTFIGASVPELRKCAAEVWKDYSINELSSLISSRIHEYRMTALFILIYKFRQAEKENNETDRKLYADFYLNNTAYINNWDLVDLSAEKILGPWFSGKNKAVLYKLAAGSSMWEQRIAVLTGFYFIKNKDFQYSLDITSSLIGSRQDLIHKALGWMLREIGKRDLKTELTYLDANYHLMPRTMLRYAIEKFPEELRLYYLKKKLS
jgi:3-methyladenine DNA glycosylase AlkD